jgi:hypothetical protein
MTRVKWTEKARRLAEKHGLWDTDGGTIENTLVHSGLYRPSPILAFGIEDEDHDEIWWKYKDGTIDVGVRVRRN